MVTQYIDTGTGTYPNTNFDATHFSHDDLRSNKFQVEIHEHKERDNINLRDITNSIVVVKMPDMSIQADDVAGNNFINKFPQAEIKWGDGHIVFRVTTDMALFFYVYNNMTKNAQNPTYDPSNDRFMQEHRYSGKNMGLKHFMTDIHHVILNNHNEPVYRLIYRNIWFKHLTGIEMNTLEGSPDVMYLKAVFSCDFVEFGQC